MSNSSLLLEPLKTALRQSHPEFDSADSALTYAAVQGRYWLINPKAFA